MSNLQFMFTSLPCFSQIPSFIYYSTFPLLTHSLRLQSESRGKYYYTTALTKVTNDVHVLNPTDTSLLPIPLTLLKMQFSSRLSAFSFSVSFTNYPFTIPYLLAYLRFCPSISILILSDSSNLPCLSNFVLFIIYSLKTLKSSSSGWLSPLDSYSQLPTILLYWLIQVK